MAGAGEEDDSDLVGVLDVNELIIDKRGGALVVKLDRVRFSALVVGFVSALHRRQKMRGDE